MEATGADNIVRAGCFLLAHHTESVRQVNHASGSSAEE